MRSKFKACRRCNGRFKIGTGGSTLDWTMCGDLHDCCSDGCAIRAAYDMMPRSERRRYTQQQYVDGQPVPVII